MAKLYNLAQMTTATVGTGTITLVSAVSPFLTFPAAGVQNNDVVTYAIQDVANVEIGYGTYTSAGTTLTRNVITSSNSNAPINLTGNAIVFVTASAQDVKGYTGTFTLNASATSTIVSNAGILPTSRFYWWPTTQDASQMVPFLWLPPANIITGQVTMAHVANAAVDLTYYYKVEQ